MKEQESGKRKVDAKPADTISSTFFQDSSVTQLFLITVQCSTRLEILRRLGKHTSVCNRNNALFASILNSRSIYAWPALQSRSSRIKHWAQKGNWFVNFPRFL